MPAILLFNSVKTPIELTRVIVRGYLLTRSPPASRIVALLNIAGVLETDGRLPEAVEAVRLCGLALLQARRCVQAAEMFRKAEEYLFQMEPVTRETVL